MLSLRHFDNVFFFVFYQVKFHFRSWVQYFSWLLLCLFPHHHHSHHKIILQFGWFGPTPSHSEMSAHWAKLIKVNSHRNVFRHPKPEPINTVLDTRFEEGPLIHVKHLTCVVTGPPSGSKGGRTRLLFLLAAICVPERRWPSGDTGNGEAPWESRRPMWFGVTLENISLHVSVIEVNKSP